MKRVSIIGVRGIPNRYGGFERLIEVLAPHLAASGRHVTVFCEAEDSSAASDQWHGVQRRFLRRKHAGPLGTIRYDLDAFRSVSKDSVALVFGYGTALFQLILRARGIPHCVNMDGIEWQRDKWGFGARSWLRLNEAVAARVGNLLIADHPEIERYLHDRYRVDPTMIAYGVDPDPPMSPPEHALELLQGRAFFLVIARPEPENQIHIALDAYRRSGSSAAMLVIGDCSGNEYGRQLMASYPEVTFLGGIYDLPLLNRLRRNAVLYVHGHRVGGTNPSLIEAMAAGAIVAAHDNPFNRWVLGKAGMFFGGPSDLAELMRNPPDTIRQDALRSAYLERCDADFLWPHILGAYEEVVDQLERMAP